MTTPNITYRRNSDAIAISDGACNPSGIARSLVTACDEARAHACDCRHDPAVRLIVSQLAYICGIWDGISDFSRQPDFTRCREECEKAEKAATMTEAVQ